MRPMRVVSLGAGVQSSAMLLLALDGAFGELPDCAIFADTQDEPPQVYETLNRLEQLSSIEIHRVTAGRLSDDYLAGGEGWVPTYIRNQNNEKSQIKRQCTYKFKIKVIKRKIRSLVGSQGTAEQLIGISIDEAHRMKPSKLQWLTNRYPLIDAGLNRNDCLQVLRDKGLTVAKSACVYCPYKGDRDWIEMKRNDPESFERACQFDEKVRDANPRFKQFVHRSLKPLRQVEFLHENQHDLFGEECEGMCGV